jgi:hypothetical protein
MRIDTTAYATRFADTLLQAGWNRHYGNRRHWTSWDAPDGTRTGERGIMLFLLTVHPDAYYLSNHILRKMARYADQLPAQRALSDAA